MQPPNFCCPKRGVTSLLLQLSGRVRCDPATKEVVIRGKGALQQAPHLAPHLPGPQGVSPEDDGAVPTACFGPVVQCQDVGGEAAL